MACSFSTVRALKLETSEEILYCNLHLVELSTHEAYQFRLEISLLFVKGWFIQTDCESETKYDF